MQEIQCVRFMDDSNESKCCCYFSIIQLVLTLRLVANCSKYIVGHEECS